MSLLKVYQRSVFAESYKAFIFNFKSLLLITPAGISPGRPALQALKGEEGIWARALIPFPFPSVERLPRRVHFVRHEERLATISRTRLTRLMAAVESDFYYPPAAVLVVIAESFN